MTCRDEVLDAIAALRSRHGRRDVALFEIVQELQARGTSYKGDDHQDTRLVPHVCQRAGPPRGCLRRRSHSRWAREVHPGVRPGLRPARARLIVEYQSSV